MLKNIYMPMGFLQINQYEEHDTIYMVISDITD